jgi:hypothetical protein
LLTRQQRRIGSSEQDGRRRGTIREAVCCIHEAAISRTQSLKFGKLWSGVPWTTGREMFVKNDDIFLTAGDHASIGLRLEDGACSRS